MALDRPPPDRSSVQGIESEDEDEIEFDEELMQKFSQRSKNFTY
jgi:hypothetical protein